MVRPNRLYGFGAHIICMAILAVVHISIYYGHYFKGWGFPWDFNMGFFAMSYAQVRDYALGQIRLWQPHGFLGYPWSLAIENFSFYPPAMALGALNLEFTYKTAVIFQTIHVLFGAIGAYLLARERGHSHAISLLAAVIFHLSACFFSNAQHSDMVRGSAFAPWLLLCASPSVVLKGIRAIPVVSLVFFSFLSGSYPGVIVASAYCVGAYVLARTVLLESQERKRYLFLLSASAFIAILTISIKFLPVLFLLDEVRYVATDSIRGRVIPAMFLTLLFDHKNPIFLTDYNMTALFIPPVVFGSAFFVNREALKRNFDILAVLVVSTVLFSVNPLGDFLASFMPGLKVSRWSLTDYRGFFHIALILTALSPCSSIYRSTLVKHIARLALFLVAFAALAHAAVGLNIHVSAEYIAAASVAIFAPAVITSFRRGGSVHMTFGKPFASFAVALSMITGLMYWWNSADYWQWRNWNDLPKYMYHFDFEEFFAIPKDPYSHSISYKSPYRPHRHSFSNVNDFGLRGYFTGCYTDLAYDGGLRIKRNILWAYYLFPRTPALKQFMNSPSSFVITTSSEIRKPGALLDLISSGKSGETASVKMESFSDGGSVFKIRVSESVLMFENELYFPGWKGTLSDDGRPRNISAVDGPYGLRGWALPPGEYTLSTYYAPPGHGVAVALTLSGLVLMFTASVIGALAVWRDIRGGENKI